MSLVIPLTRFKEEISPLLVRTLPCTLMLCFLDLQQRQTMAVDFRDLLFEWSAELYEQLTLPVR